MGLIFATHIALAWQLLRRNDEFRSALASRDIIGQAKGTIMERFDMDAVQAFDLLVRLSKEVEHQACEHRGAVGAPGRRRAGTKQSGRSRR